MDEQFGPMLWEDILRMARDGARSPTDSIRRETSRRWKHLDQMLLRTPRGTNPANDAVRPAAGLDDSVICGRITNCGCRAASECRSGRRRRVGRTRRTDNRGRAGR